MRAFVGLGGTCNWCKDRVVGGWRVKSGDWCRLYGKLGQGTVALERAAPPYGYVQGTAYPPYLVQGVELLQDDLGLGAQRRQLLRPKQRHGAADLREGHSGSSYQG